MAIFQQGYMANYLNFQLLAGNVMHVSENGGSLVHIHKEKNVTIPPMEKKILGHPHFLPIPYNRAFAQVTLISVATV